MTTLLESNEEVFFLNFSDCSKLIGAKFHHKTGPVYMIVSKSSGFLIKSFLCLFIVITVILQESGLYFCVIAQINQWLIYNYTLRIIIY